MGKIPDEERLSIIKSILATHAKTGCTIQQLNRDYKEYSGENLAASRNEGIDLLNSMPEVYCENGLYFSASQKSRHIVKFVEEQNLNRKPPFRPNFSFQRQHSSASRPVVSYADWDTPSTSNAPACRPSRIQDRRKSAYYETNMQQRERPKRRNSCIDGRDETFGPKPKRSRSKSPERNYRNEHDDRWKSRQSNNNDRSRRMRRSRSPSPRLRRSPSPKYRPKRSPSTKRSPSFRRSTSPKRSNSRQSRSPPSKRHARSPNRNIPRKSPPTHPSNERVSQSLERKTHTPENSPPKPKEPTVVNTSTPLSGQSKADQNSKAQKATNSKLNGQPKKPKKYKFTVIGDAYMYYLMLDMQGVETEMPFCSHNKTFIDAINMLEIQKERLQQRRKKVLISLGASDLRINRSFGDMKRDFTHLFLKCDEYGLKPLVTTILCIDTPELKLRADMFNRFLMENFQNVVDMGQVGRHGLADTILLSQNRNGHHSMELGRLQQLILNV